MMGFGYREVSGHTIKEPDGSSFREPDSGMKLNGWIDLIIEYRRGPIRISVNGHSKTYKHENVTVDNQDDEHGHRFTSKGGDGSKIVFDSVRLWECSRGEYLQVVH